MKNKKTLDGFNIDLNNKQIRILLIIIIILVVVLLFRKKFNNTIEKIIVFSILFLLFLIISRNLIITFFGSCLIFLLVNLIIQYRNTVENFEDLNDRSDKNSDYTKTDIDINTNLSSAMDLLKSSDGLKSFLEKSKDLKSGEPEFDINLFNSPDFTKSADGIQSLLKKVNGGISLTEHDTKETDKLGVDTTKYSDDNKHNSLKKAQKEAYELIDSVNALKDTITTLAPVLQEGKKLMNIFENLKI
jgi:uncharacterized membrane protein required for colicin V production